MYTNRRHIILCLILTMLTAGGLYSVADEPAADEPTVITVPISSIPLTVGKVWRHIYTDIAGDTVSDLEDSDRYPKRPDLYRSLTALETEYLYGDDYGQRIYGFIKIDETAGADDYVFSISSKNGSEFQLCMDDHLVFEEGNLIPTNLTRICHVYRGVDLGVTDKYLSQTSEKIPLEGGRAYYFELRMKAGTVGDHLSAYIKCESKGIAQQVLSGDYLAAHTDARAPVEPGVPPRVTFVADRVVELAWNRIEGAWGGLQWSGIAGYKVFRNGTEIGFAPGSRLPTYRDDTCEPETEYYYQIKTVDNAGNLSEEASPRAILELPDGTTTDVITTESMPRRPQASGLTASFYNRENSSQRSAKRVHSRIDPNIDFDWGEDQPYDGGKRDNWSVRWEGYIFPLYDEEYTLYVNSDDGMMVVIDGETVVADWKHHEVRETSGTVELRPLGHHKIVVYYHELEGPAVAQLLWESKREPKGIIPAGCFGPSQIATGKSLEISTPDTSFVSPAWVEGENGADTSEITVEVDGLRTDAIRTGEMSYYADNASERGLPPGIVLSADEPTPITISNEEGMTLGQTISWTPIDLSERKYDPLLNKDALPIRAGSSLLLTTSTPGATMTLHGFSEVFEGPAGSKVPVQVPAGNFRVSLTLYDRAGERLSTEWMSIVSVGPPNPAPVGCPMYRKRELTIPLPENATFLYVRHANMRERTRVYPWVSTSSTLAVGTEHGSLWLRPRFTGIDTLYLRMGNYPHRPILCGIDTHSFNLNFTEAATLPVLQDFGDGTQLFASTINVDPVFKGHFVKMETLTQGARFEESGTSTALIPTDNANQHGNIIFYLISGPRNQHCHNFRGIQETEEGE